MKKPALSINFLLSASFVSTSIISASIISACASAPQAQATPAEQTRAAQTTTRVQNALTQEQKFAAWKVDFINRAAAKGHDRARVARIINPAQINELALDRDSKQPEFTKPVWSYVDNAASADRLNKGRAKLDEAGGVFTQIEARYPVPRHILTAIWGLETAYGRIMGDHDIISALSTFAFEGRRSKFGEQQLFAVLDMLKAGDVREDQLVGSWAGAMGMTQFIPTTFRDYAVDFDKDGNKNLWESQSDALGSAAHYLARSGWRAGEPVMAEVKVVDEFDYSLLEGTTKTVSEWTALGVSPINGERWSPEANFLNAKIIAPGGHRGPKLLTFKNFDVIKRYNNSTSYVMGVTVLGEALRGNSAIRTAWPRGDKPLSFENKKSMQRKLTQLGYSTGGVDGQIGPNTRKAIRSWQKSNSLPADGYMEQSLYQRLMAQ
ncbi:MAG: lytic murein transglycosylase [Litorimonas sp.]